jgi:hypothetical protein
MRDADGHEINVGPRLHSPRDSASLLIQLLQNERCTELYAEFSFAYFQMAMVFIARNQLGPAEQALRSSSAFSCQRSALAPGRDSLALRGCGWCGGGV